MQEDIQKYADRLPPEKQDILRRVERIGGELLIKPATRGRSIWVARFPDSDGWYSIYKRRADCLGLDWLYHIGLSESMDWAVKAQAAALEIVRKETEGKEA